MKTDQCHEYIISYSPDSCMVERTDMVIYGAIMVEIYNDALKKLKREQGDLISWNNSFMWIGKASNSAEFFKKFQEILIYTGHNSFLSSKLIRAYLEGFYGTMYGGVNEKIIHIDPKEARIVEGQKLYFAWGWPGPDINIYRLKDYGETWALTQEEFNI